MTKILMIQLQPVPYAGTAYLNGATLSKGHEFVLFLNTDSECILQKIKEENPGIIGFSCMSCLAKDIIAIAKEIKKKFEVPIIIGGPHPTLFPEVIEEDCFDIICRGEGEEALIELLDAIEKKQDYSKIQNLYVKKNGEIYRNELRQLIEPLDKAPVIDWSCYKGTSVQNSPPIVFPIRGCPFSCSYCFNAKTRDMYNGKGNYLRHFSVERTILETKKALEVFSHSPVLFTSDSFGTDLEWMDSLFGEYEKITKLPFVLLLRPELVTEKCVDILAKHNCFSVAIGVESGSERVRSEVMNRNYSNKLLLEVGERLHKKGIKFRAYSMIGLPTETEEEMWETIDINIKMKTDFPKASIFIPLPGTKIVELAKEEGYLGQDFYFKDIPYSVLSETILKKLNKDKIKNTLYFFQTMIIFPKSRGIIKKLIKIKPNIFFRLWFYLIHAYLHKKSEKRSLIPFIKYIFSNRKYK